MSTIALSSHRFHRHKAASAPPARHRRRFFRWLFDAIVRSNQLRAERDIARMLGTSGGRLTDEMERRIMEGFTSDRGFRL